MNGEASNTPKLIILSGKHRGEEFLLTADGMTVGRTKDADHVVKDKSISRRHAQFLHKGTGWVVKDLDSKNGLRVNNHETDEQGLRTGDVVSLGGVKLKFVDPSELVPIPGAAGAPPQLAPPLPPANPPFPEQAPPQWGFAPPPGREAPLSPYPRQEAQPPSPGAPPAGGPALPSRYAPQEGATPDVYAPPPEFFAPQVTDRPKATLRKPLTRSVLVMYLGLFGAVGLGLGYLVYVTFFLKSEPFREDVKLAVREVRLLDMARHVGRLRGASHRVTSPRVADSKYDGRMAVLTVEGKALGNTDIVFLDGEGGELGKVSVHVLKGERKAVVDRTMFTVDQLKAQARETMAEGDRLAKAHLASAIKKYKDAVDLLAWVEDPQLRAMATMKLTELEGERDRRFNLLKDKYSQANKLNELSLAKDLLDEICRLFPDTSNVEHQRAQIFLKRIELQERMQRNRK